MKQNKGICLQYEAKKGEVVEVQLRKANRVTVFPGAAALWICPPARISVMGFKGECLASYPWRDVVDARVRPLRKEKGNGEGPTSKP